MDASALSKRVWELERENRELRSEVERLREKEKEEEWKDVAGFEGLYSVSSLGRIRNDRLGTVMTGGRRPDGYLGFVFCRSREDRKTMLVHRVVATAFLGVPEDGMQVNHKNGIRFDNRASNLEWVTASENQLHCSRVLNSRPGQAPKPKFGEDHANSKFKEDEIRQIRRLYAAGGITQQKLAEMFNTTQTTVGGIVRRKSWPHIQD